MKLIKPFFLVTDDFPLGILIPQMRIFLWAMSQRQMRK